jgi:hypothetical protein
MLLPPPQFKVVSLPSAVLMHVTFVSAQQLIVTDTLRGPSARSTCEKTPASQVEESVNSAHGDDIELPAGVVTLSLVATLVAEDQFDAVYPTAAGV